MQLTQTQIKKFQQIIYDYYNTHGRIFSWRQTVNPYYIFVSEVMLQQTQTKRVEKKYKEFLTRFPDFDTLANAPLYDVLEAWQGLGYNRRAKFLQQSAKMIVSQFDGNVPTNVKTLQTLPGIGVATAASIAAFAYNLPTAFVETNIRVVFIYMFLPHKDNISDTELLSLAEQTLDRSSPRIWYYAITDYGAMLKSKGINPINKSKIYNKQSRFEGSDRQIRGEIIRQLLKHKKQRLQSLCLTLQDAYKASPDRIKRILKGLLNENLVTSNAVGKRRYFSLTS